MDMDFSHGIIRMRARQADHRQKNRRPGATAVELAIVLPMLLLIVVGTVDFGRIAAVSITLNNATGAGAEYAASHRFTESTAADWEDRVREVVAEEMQQASGFSPESFTVAISTNSDAEDVLHVTIETGYSFRTVIDWPGIPSVTALRQRLTVTPYR